MHDLIGCLKIILRTPSHCLSIKPDRKSPISDGSLQLCNLARYLEEEIVCGVLTACSPLPGRHGERSYHPSGWFHRFCRQAPESRPRHRHHRLRQSEVAGLRRVHLHECHPCGSGRVGGSSGTVEWQEFPEYTGAQL